LRLGQIKNPAHENRTNGNVSMEGGGGDGRGADGGYRMRRVREGGVGVDLGDTLAGSAGQSSPVQVGARPIPRILKWSMVSLRV
jgi:hypothetical protein